MSRFILIGAFLFLANSLKAQWSASNVYTFGGVYAIERNSDTLYAGCDGGMLMSLNDGVSWMSAYDRNTNRLYRSIKSIKVYNSKVYFLDDKIQSGTFSYAQDVTYAATVFSLQPSWQNSFVSDFDFYNNVQIDGESNGLSFTKFSTTSGLSFFSPFSSKKSVNLQGDSVINSVLVSGNNILIGSRSGFYFMKADSTFELRNNGLSSKHIFQLKIVGSKILACTYNGLYESSDQGLNWSLSGMSGLSVFCVTSDNSNIYVGTENGIFYSPIASVDWKALSNGLPSGVYINCLFVSSNNILAGTGSQGIWKLSNTAIASGEGSNLPNTTTVPGENTCLYTGDSTECVKFHNPPTAIKNIEGVHDLNLFPNPSTGIFKLSILPDYGEWKIGIYNSIGNLVSDYKSLALSNIEINLSGNPKGIYFLKCTNGKVSFYKKMILN